MAEKHLLDKTFPPFFSVKSRVLYAGIYGIPELDSMAYLNMINSFEIEFDKQ